MKIQVNSDKTIAVDASLMRFVEDAARRALGRFEDRITRVEVHLSDVDSRKRSDADKRCLVEARPAGAPPMSTSAQAKKLAPAVRDAMKKMQRLLTGYFERKGWTSRGGAAAQSPSQAAAGKTRPRKKRAGAKKAAARKAAKLASRRLKKKWIYQARRKRWPSR